MKYGNREVKHGLFLGPMAGVTDTVYRELCQNQGCEVTYTEMVSAKAIHYNNKKTGTLLTIGDNEFNVGVQLFGREPELLGEIAKRIDNEKIGSFDVNMGCPVPKIVNNGEGSALMKEPKLIGDIVTSLVKAVDKPVTIKIRAGFDDSNLNAPEICKIAESCGASHVAIHGRTREQYYSGVANWDIIREAKEGVSIPIIGNGDVNSGEQLLKIMEHTNCDGVMVGRAAMGNPWIFRELVNTLEGKPYARPELKEVIDTMLLHGKLLIEHKGEYVAMREMRKQVTWYTKGLKNATRLRSDINRVETYKDLHELIQQFLL